jgi:hypothetical protein
MTQLEDQLRLAFRAKASQITPPPPPLELQPRPVLDPAARRGSGRAGTPLQQRWLVPLAAAVAVLAVIAGALTVSGTLAGHRTPLSLPATTPIQTSVPAYYVALTSVRPMPVRKPQAWPVLTTATVRATSTGAVLATVVPPHPYTTFTDVSAAADDRYFVLAAEYQMGKNTGPYHVGFFLLRINPAAAYPPSRTSLTALPAAALPGDDQLEAMALSPDGRLLATGALHLREQPDGPKGLVATTYLKVYDLVTGHSRTWTDLGGEQGFYPVADPRSGGLSWQQDGRFLAIPGSVFGQLRLLNVTAPGHQATSGKLLAAASRVIKALAAPAPPCEHFCFYNMTPDGKTVFVEYVTGWWAPGQPLWYNLVQLNVRMGTVTRINKLTVSAPGGHYSGYNPRADLGPDDVLWTSYDGSKVIVVDIRPGTPNAGVYSGGHYTPIPWPANIVAAAW